MKRPQLTRRDFLNGSILGAAGMAVSSMAGGYPFRNFPGLINAGGGRPSPTGAFNPFELCHGVMGGQSWDPPPASGDLLDCIILGGGMSGLTAAWKLRRLGLRDVLILEKNDRIGGQCRSLTTQSGLLASQASAYASIPYTRILTELYTDLGFVTGTTPDGGPLINENLLLKPPYARHWIDGTWFDDPWLSEAALDALPFSSALLADLREFRDIVEWWYDFEGNDGKPGFASPIDDASHDPDILWLDNQSLAEYAAYEGIDPGVTEFLDPLLRSVFCLSHEELSAYVGVDFLTSEILPGDESVICQQGGNAFIAQKIAESIGASGICLNSFALKAVNSGDEVHVSYLEDGQAKTIRAKSAIYACPRMMAPYLLPETSAPPKTGSRFEYGAYIVANIETSETPRDLAYANELHGDFFFTDFTLADWASLEDPVNAPPARPNVLTVYAPLTGAGRRMELLSTPIETYEEMIFADLERVLPGISEIATGFDLFRWGHPMVLAKPGMVFSDLRTHAKDPVGHIHFAGHETEGVPYVDNAIMAGARAAAEVAERLAPVPREALGRSG